MRRFRNYSIEITLLTILVVSIGYFTYLAYGLMEGNRLDLEFSGQRALSDATNVIAFGPRIPGSPESLRASAWITDHLLSLGWDVTVQVFEHQTGSESVQAHNLIAMRSPQSAAAPVGILVTHYDTRLFADADENPDNRTVPGLAANKSASGAAILLELARTLDIEATEMTLCLAFFDAEENEGIAGWRGRLGSEVFWNKLQQSTNPASGDGGQDWSTTRCAAPRFVIAVDLVGYHKIAFYPPLSATSATSSEAASQSDPTQRLYQALQQTAIQLGDDTLFQPEDATGKITDTITGTLNSATMQSSADWFTTQNIPTLTLNDLAYPYSHTLSDTIDKINSESLRRVGRVLEVWLEKGGNF